MSDFYKMLREYTNKGLETAAPFDEAFRTIIGHEGGYVNTPTDPGGETKYGIAKRFNPDIDIPNLTLDDAKKIYKKRYWDKYNLDSFEDKDKTTMFDMIINSPKRAATAMQNVTGATPDGVVGPKTLKAIQSYKGDIGAEVKKEYFRSLVRDKDLNKERQENWASSANGWANRYLDTNKFGTRKGEIDLRNKPLKEVLKLIK
jgi:lysozyme family protein